MGVPEFVRLQYWVIVLTRELHGAHAGGTRRQVGCQGRAVHGEEGGEEGGEKVWRLPAVSGHQPGHRVRQ